MAVFSEICVLLVLFSFTFQEAPAVRVTLYEHFDFEGEVYEVEVKKTCLDVRRDRNDWASSIEIPTGGCINLFPHYSCEGDSWELRTNYSDFSKNKFNDKLSSLRNCTTKKAFFPTEMKEVWLESNQTVQRNYGNGDVAINLNSDLRRNEIKS